MRSPLLGAFASLCLVAPLCAQRPSVAPTRLAQGESIIIDGSLDEAIWARAAKLGALTQTEPFEGREPSRPTEVRLAFDEDFIYMSLRCIDEPGNVRARQRDRDARVRYDDVVEWWIDTFDDQRSAFWFQITAAGSRGDALISDAGSSFNKRWDAIWYGEARVTSEGWQAEIAIPFKSLAFEKGQTTWGFNLRRKRIVNGESSRWASPLVAYRFFLLAEGGALTGLSGMKQGLGLDVVPYVKGGISRDRTDPDSEDFDFDGEAGLDLSYRITPSATLRLTYNTDFAETEVDELRSNLTKFPLFFPEKRDFFLEDAGLFEFGASERYPTFMPFHSRTIGRDPDGKAVPITGGVKLTGRFGDWSVGFLETAVEGYGLGEAPDVEQINNKNLGVLRVGRSFGGESSVGMILTDGNPSANLNTQTYGMDFRIGSSRFFGEGHSGNIWGWWLASASEDDESEGQAIGLKASAYSSVWQNQLRATQIDEGFDPALGFVRRTGIRRFFWRTEYTLRADESSFFREYKISIDPSFTEDLNGREDRLKIPFTWMELVLDSEDEIELKTTRVLEHLAADLDKFPDGSGAFELSGVPISPGDYQMTLHELSLQSNSRRRLGGDVEVEFGDFYGGTLMRYQVSPIFLPGPLFKFQLDYENIRASLDQGDFHRELISANVDFSFTPAVSWKNIAQYDTDENEVALQTRLHWILEPGHDLFLVGQFGWIKDAHDDPFVPTAQDLILKMTYTLRF